MIQFFLLFFPRGPQQKNPEFWKIQIIKVNKAEFSLKKKNMKIIWLRGFSKVYCKKNHAACVEW